MPSAEIPLTSLYDWRLVALSIVIAIFTCYTALDLAGRVTVARGRSTHMWLIGGAVTMGVSIWAMHFIGMEALTLPIPVAYHAPTVFVSMLVAMLVSGAAIYLASLPAMGTRKWVSGGVFMGLSIGAMHYYWHGRHAHGRDRSVFATDRHPLIGHWHYWLPHSS